MTSLTDQRPRERMYSYALDRLASLATRASLECKEPTCGARDETGELLSCSSEFCGEKLMMEGWRRELIVMRDMKALIEWLDRKELEAAAATDKKGKRK